LAAPTALERVRRLAENFLRYVEGGLYPGGCFFASIAAEMAMRPGPVRDGAVQVVDDFSRRLETAVREAQAEGAIDTSEDAAQLAFELNAYLSLANTQFALSQVSAPIAGAPRAGRADRCSGHRRVARPERSDHSRGPSGVARLRRQHDPARMTANVTCG
jgi:hypothetical protein